MNLKEYEAYKKTLELHERLALEKAVRGMSLVVLIGIIGMAAGGAGMDDTEYLAQGVVRDANYSINFPKLVRKLKNNPVVNQVNNVVN